MQESLLFKQGQFYRGMLVNSLKDITEDVADYQAPGFNNTIRWNAGHVLFTQDQIITKALGLSSGLPESYKDLFAPGTSPANWKEEAPQMSILVEQLNNQVSNINGMLTGKLDDNTTQPFKLGQWIEFNTLGEVYNFTLFHEGMHIGTIRNLLNQLKR